MPGKTNYSKDELVQSFPLALRDDVRTALSVLPEDRYSQFHGAFQDFGGNYGYMRLPIVPRNCELLLLSYSHEAIERLVASPPRAARCSTPRSKGGGVGRYCVSDTPYRAASSGQTSVTVATAGLAPKDRTRALRPSSLGPSWQRTVDRRSLGSRTNALPPMLRRRLDGRPSLGTYRAALQ